MTPGRKALALVGFLVFLAVWGVLVVRFLEARPRRGGDAREESACAADSHAGHDHEEESGGALALSEEQRRLFGIELAKAGPGRLERHLRLTGEIVLNADRVAHVVPRVPGVACDVRHTVGQTVVAGELLAVLESADVGEAKVEFLGRRRALDLAELDLERARAVRQSTEAVLHALGTDPSLAELPRIGGREMGEERGRLLSAYAERAAARLEHEREKRLAENQIGAETDLVAAANAWHKAEAEYDALLDSLQFASLRGLRDAERARADAAFGLAAAGRRLVFLGLPESVTEALAAQPSGELSNRDLNRVELRAPVAGTILEKHIAVGEMLDGVERVYTIADLTTVWADLAVHGADLPAVVAGTPAEIRSSFHAGRADGSVAIVIPQVDEGTRTATARVVLDNADGAWRPGMFVTADLRLPTAERPLVVPRLAVQTIQGENVVFVPSGADFVTRIVRLGANDRSQAEIMAGLAAGESYVAKGAFELKARLLTANLDPHAGHGH